MSFQLEVASCDIHVEMVHNDHIELAGSPDNDAGDDDKDKNDMVAYKMRSSLRCIKFIILILWPSKPKM